MAVLGAASRVYVGTTQAVKVYMGSANAWPLTPLAAKLVFPGVAANYLQTPHQASFQITGSLELVVRASLNWQSATEVNYLAARFAATGGGGRCFSLYMDSAFPGRPRMVISADGTATTTATATSAVSFANGVIGWFKATYDPVTATIRFYSAADAATEPSTWTQVGGDRTGQPASMFVGTAPLTLGGQLVSTTGPLLGRMYRFIMRNGIGGSVVFDMNEDNANANIPSQFPATSGHVVSAVVTAGNQIIQPRVP